MLSQAVFAQFREIKRTKHDFRIVYLNPCQMSKYVPIYKYFTWFSSKHISEQHFKPSFCVFETPK